MIGAIIAKWRSHSYSSQLAGIRVGDEEASRVTTPWASEAHLLDMVLPYFHLGKQCSDRVRYEQA